MTYVAHVHTAIDLCCCSPHAIPLLVCYAGFVSPLSVQPVVVMRACMCANNRVQGENKTERELKLRILHIYNRTWTMIVPVSACNLLFLHTRLTVLRMIHNDDAAASSFRLHPKQVAWLSGIAARSL